MDSEHEAEYRKEVQEQLTQWERTGGRGEQIKAASELLEAIENFENLRDSDGEVIPVEGLKRVRSGLAQIKNLARLAFASSRLFVLARTLRI